MPNLIEILNKKATFQYFLLDHFTAGIMLTGTEIKSIRQGKATMSDAYCMLTKKGEAFIKNMHIAEYKYGSINNHEPKRARKLLLKKNELKKIDSKLKEKGYTLIPVKLFVNEEGKAKLEVALSKGKKSFDKRDSIKQKDQKRELDRSFKFN